MGEKLQELLNLAAQVEAAPDNTLKAMLLAEKVLNFGDDHVVTGTMLKSGIIVEVCVPMLSPLRNGIAKIVSTR